MRAFRTIMTGFVLVCLSPFAAALLASLVAFAAGCDFDLGLAHACAVGGSDIGGALQVLGSFAYATFFTVPLLLLALLVWGGAEVIHRLRVRRSGSHPLARI